ncbi:MAG: YggS family pyridoxal phosphate-dependent enzyme [Clostridia bacterium]|nr:YggS family pyridoxal phosphate-dependent enzyme [Clostridia bacterium]
MITEQTRALMTRVEDIRARMRAAGDRGQVTLLAAVKYATAEQIDALIEHGGVCDIGENRVQQLLEHYEAMHHRDRARIHFIGSLQTNKVKYIADKVCMIHSLDSYRLGQEIEKQCAKIGKTMDVLAEINSGREQNKGGLLPEEAAEFCLSLRDFPHLRLRGFMTMAPKCEKFEEYRKFFAETYQNGLDIWRKKLDNIGGAPIMSMGMSDSFEAAIMEGATIVRVGGALFRD